MYSEEEIVKKYPKIFRDYKKSPMETGLAWGFECWPGWNDLIELLCHKIQSHIDLNPHLGNPQVVATQVKEKYGVLEFYIMDGDDFVDGMISFAREVSAMICEKCGSNHNVTQSKGWIMTRCDKCRKVEGW